MTGTTTTWSRVPRPVTLLSAVLTAGLVLAACGGGQSAGEAAGGGADAEASGAAAEFDGTYDGEPVELSYWNGFTGGDGPFMEELVAQFNDEHENIAVTSNTIQWADFYQRVPAAVQAGEGPDVGVMHLDQLPTNAARDVIIPLDDLTDALDLSADDFTEEVWDAGVYDDQRYGIPLDVHSLAMYWNTEHFEAAGITEPPTDEASFLAALDALQAAGYENPFWMPTLWPSHLYFLSLTWQNGGDPYAGDGSSATFADEAGVAAMEWQRSIVEDGYSPPDVAIDSQYQAFKNGETSITWDGIWQINDLEATEVPYGIAPVPTIGEQEAVWANSHHFFISNQAEQDPDKLEASKVFVAWMSEQSGEWAGSGMIPARLSVRDSGAMDGMPQEVIADQIDSMRFLPPVPGLGGVQAEALEPAVSESVLGSGEAADLLSTASDQATELMERNQQSFGG
ncbi:ABC transporter substrate-binding protein [Aquipuribacter sp. MA13-6]|uniref:ABC transporter substrate-binding protein n=1 Tax=unclassified Aquipuribacter TaxID=2635084 RepID=UPI003EEF682B